MQTGRVNMKNVQIFTGKCQHVLMRSSTQSAFAELRDINTVAKIPNVLSTSIQYFSLLAFKAAGKCR